MMKKLIVLLAACTGLGALVGFLVDVSLKDTWYSPGFFDARGCSIIGFGVGCLICILYWVFKGSKKEQ